jgi:RND family efflux transporter MFP subunit
VAATFDLDDEIQLEEASWVRRFLGFGGVLLVAAVAAALIYYFFFRDDVETVRATEDIPVKRATINSTLIISGTADTQLNSDLIFQTSGRVATVNVTVGDVVQEGQVLASLESDNLANGVAQAEANVRAAQLKVDDLIAGSTAAERAAAEQSLAQAEAQLVSAQNELDDLLEPPSVADRATAAQAVATAEASLANAISNRDELDEGATDADVAAAEAAVASAESALKSAENTAENAQNSVTSTEAALKSAETQYCDADNAPSFCTVPAAPISSGDKGLMETALGGTNSSDASAVISANSSYLNAVNALDSAEGAVDSAEKSLASAEKKLDALGEGASDRERAAADAAVLSAQAALGAAQAKLADLEDGPTPAERSNAEASVNSAAAAVGAARAKLAEVVRGAEQNDLDQARQAVRTAQLSAEAARIRLRDSQIIAPFAGTVAAVNITPGEFASASASATDGAAIVLLTPERVVLMIDVNETDYPNLTAGQGGVALFDGLPGRPYPFSITKIGLTPTVTQGVVTFQVEADLAIIGDAPRPAPGMNARGQLTVGSKPDVLVVPPRAIRRRGTEQVVDVRKDGQVQEIVVTTGLSDTTNVEVLTGLAEGDVVVVPSVGAGPGGATGGPTPVPTLPGGIR